MKNKKLGYVVYILLTVFLLFLARQNLFELKGRELDLVNFGISRIALRDGFLSVNFLFADWVTVMLPRLDFAEIEPMLLLRHPSLAQASGMRLKKGWYYGVIAILIHLVYLPATPVAWLGYFLTVVLIWTLLFYQRRFLPTFSEGWLVFACLLALRLILSFII